MDIPPHKLARTIAALRCDRHPDYSIRQFCARKQCGFGLLCDACHELDHRPLLHHSLDGIARDAQLDLDTFLPTLLRDGLHFEEQEELRRNVSSEEAGRIRARLLQLEREKADQARALAGQLDALLADLLLKVELRTKKLKRDLLADLEAVFDREIQALRFLTNASDRLLAKQVSAQTRFTSRLTDLGKKKKLTSAACTFELQLLLVTAFSEAEVRLLRQVREGLAYLDEPQSVAVDLEGLAVSLNLQVLNELEHMFGRIGSVAAVDESLQQRLSLAPTADMIGSADSLVDERVQLLGERRVSAVLAHEGLVLVGFADGVVRVYTASGLGLNEHAYESSHTLHSASVSLLAAHSHQGRLLLCSADVAFCLSFSHLDSAGDFGLQLHYRVPQAHSGKVLKLLSLPRSAFVVSFGLGDRVKVWNVTDQYLALIVDQYNHNRVLDVCTFNDDRCLCLGYSHALNIHKLEYSSTSRSIRALLVAAVKTASTHLSLLSIKLYVYVLRSDDATNHLMSFHETGLELQPLASCPLDRAMRIVAVGGQVFAYSSDPVAQTVRFLDASFKPVHTVTSAILFDDVPLQAAASTRVALVGGDLRSLSTTTLEGI